MKYFSHNCGVKASGTVRATMGVWCQRRRTKKNNCKACADNVRAGRPQHATEGEEAA